MKWLFVLVLVVSLLVIISSFFINTEKSDMSSSPFECGIDPINEVKAPFYMHFFYVAILFLIFDVELALMIPLVYSHLSGKMWNLYWLSFLTILLVGLLLELSLGSLEWKE